MTIAFPRKSKNKSNASVCSLPRANTGWPWPHRSRAKNAGVGCGYPDEEYVKAGAQIVESAEEIFQRADMIVKVKEPLPAEWPLLRRGQILSPIFIWRRANL